MGTTPWLHDLVRVLDKTRRDQLNRIRSFLKLETSRQYSCPRTGKTKCVGYLVSSSKTASEWCIHLFYNIYNCFQVGGKDLKATQQYPGQLGLKAIRTNVVLTFFPCFPYSTSPLVIAGGGAHCIFHR